jgi:hypothetical protein
MVARGATKKVYQFPATHYTSAYGYPRLFFWMENGFLLSHFVKFYEESPQGTRTVNCEDMATFLCLVLASEGISSEIDQIEHDPGSEGGTDAVPRNFVTNTLKPIGGAFQPIIWSYHQVVNFDGKEYDACLALQTSPDGQPLMGPHPGFSLQDYWQSSGSPGYGYHGLTSRFQYVGDVTTWAPYGITLDPSKNPEIVPLRIVQKHTSGNMRVQ